MSALERINIQDIIDDIYNINSKELLKWMLPLFIFHLVYCYCFCFGSWFWSIFSFSFFGLTVSAVFLRRQTNVLLGCATLFATKMYTSVFCLRSRLWTCAIVTYFYIYLTSDEESSLWDLSQSHKVLKGLVIGMVYIYLEYKSWTLRALIGVFLLIWFSPIGKMLKEVLENVWGKIKLLWLFIQNLFHLFRIFVLELVVGFAKSLNARIVRLFQMVKSFIETLRNVLGVTRFAGHFQNAAQWLISSLTWSNVPGTASLAGIFQSAASWLSPFSEAISNISPGLLTSIGTLFEANLTQQGGPEQRNGNGNNNASSIRTACEVILMIVILVLLLMLSRNTMFVLFIMLLGIAAFLWATSRNSS